MRHGFRLGDFEPTQPQNADDVAVNQQLSAASDDRRLMREANRRMATHQSTPSRPKELSAVEQAMRANAPDLIDENGQVKNVRRLTDEIEGGNWPRPRALALIVIMTLAAVVPSLTVRFLIWCLILMLLTAILLGPERARDGVHATVLHLSRVWGREILFLRRLLGIPDSR